MKPLTERLVSIERALAVLALALLLILAVVQILARNLFDTGYPRVEAMSRGLVLYVMLLGAVLAVEKERHIRLDLLHHWLPNAGSRLYCWLQAVSAVVCGLFTHAAARFWWGEWQYTPDAERWAVWFALILPAGFALLTLHFTINAIQGNDAGGAQ